MKHEIPEEERVEVKGPCGACGARLYLEGLVDNRELEQAQPAPSPEGAPAQTLPLTARLRRKRERQKTWSRLLRQCQRVPRGE